MQSMGFERVLHETLWRANKYDSGEMSESVDVIHYVADLSH